VGSDQGDPEGELKKMTSKGEIGTQRRMKTIVVGYDGSEAAERALARATDIASAFSAHLTLVGVTASVHVPVAVSAFEPAAVLIPPAAAGSVGTHGTVPVTEHQPEPATPEPEELARRRLEQALSSPASRGVEADYVVEVGDPVERLLDVAHRRDADLIVVGSRERGFLERLLGHPIDEAVARRADRDVLLVH
jgi:nucleotide-binding universal stress UspA family protein